MVGDQLVSAFLAEVYKYIGLPYFTNSGRHKNVGDNVLVGKGNAKEIALKTIEFANQENIKLIDMPTQQFYNFQKKHHLGIDCSGLACQLLTYLGTLVGKPVTLDPRHTNADMLTSPSFSDVIELGNIGTGDLIRQKNGHHVVVVIEKRNDDITYVESSRDKRGVKIGYAKITDPQFFAQGVYRLRQLI